MIKIIQKGTKHKTEEDIKDEYMKFIKTDEGKEWLEFYDLGDYLYDFYPEMLQQLIKYSDQKKRFLLLYRIVNESFVSFGG